MLEKISDLDRKFNQTGASNGICFFAIFFKIPKNYGMASPLHVIQQGISNQSVQSNLPMTNKNLLQFEKKLVKFIHCKQL